MKNLQICGRLTLQDNLSDAEKLVSRLLLLLLWVTINVIKPEISSLRSDRIHKRHGDGFSLIGSVNVWLKNKDSVPSEKKNRRSEVTSKNIKSLSQTGRHMLKAVGHMSSSWYLWHTLGLLNISECQLTAGDAHIYCSGSTQVNAAQSQQWRQNKQDALFKTISCI